MTRLFGGLFRNFDFLRLWTAQGLSVLGSKLSELAIPLIAVTMLDATPVQMGLLLAAENLPFLLIGLPAGVWVDRMRKRPIMVSADVVRALCLLAIPICAYFEMLSLAVLFVVAFGVGFMNVWFDLAYGSYVPALVPRDRLIEANSKLSISLSAAETCGPAVGGVLIQLFGAPATILFNALTFVFSGLLLGGIKRREEAPPPPAPGENLRKTIGQGIRFIWNDLLMRALTARLAGWHFVVAAMEALLIIYLTRTLGITPSVIGILFSVAGVGVLIGAALGERIPQWIGTGNTVSLSHLVLAVVALLIPLAQGPKWVQLAMVGFAMFTWGFCAVTYQITNVSLRQALSPEGMLARVNAATRFASLSIRPVSAIIGGYMGAYLGLRNAIWIILCIGLAFAIRGLLSKRVREVFHLPEQRTMDVAAPITEAAT